MPITLRDSQRKSCDEVKEILRKHNLAYLAGEIRVGKTLTSIFVAHEMGWRKVCFITKKMAISSIRSDLQQSGLHFQLFEITNFEQVPNLHPIYDGYIIDEASSCFPEGTIVDGVKIEDIKVGHSLKTYSFVCNQTENKQVVHTSSHHNTDGFIRVSVGGKSIICTPDHLLYSERGWIEAKNVTNEDKLFVLPEETKHTSSV